MQGATRQVLIRYSPTTTAGDNSIAIMIKLQTGESLSELLRRGVMQKHDPSFIEWAFCAGVLSIHGHPIGERGYLTASDYLKSEAVNYALVLEAVSAVIHLSMKNAKVKKAFSDPPLFVTPDIGGGQYIN